MKEKEEEQGGGDTHLTWADAKKMPVTSRVIQETMRMASILSFTFREAVEDVEYDGSYHPYKGCGPFSTGLAFSFDGSFTL